MCPQLKKKAVERLCREGAVQTLILSEIPVMYQL